MPAKDYRARFFKYCLVGFSCSLVNWAFFYLLHYPLHIQYIAAAALAFVAATTLNYFLSIRVFQSRGGRKTLEYLLALLASTVALAIDLSVMYLLVEFAAVPKMAAKIAGSASAFFVNYLSRQFVIFSPKAG